MFKTLRDAFKIKEVRRKILYVIMMLAVIRLGSQLPDVYKRQVQYRLALATRERNL